MITTGFVKQTNAWKAKFYKAIQLSAHYTQFTCPEIFTERADWVEHVRCRQSTFNLYTETRRSWGKAHGKSDCHAQSHPSTSLDLSCQEPK